MSSTEESGRPHEIVVGLGCYTAATVVTLVMQLLYVDLTRVTPEAWEMLLTVVVLVALVIWLVHEGYELAWAALAGLLAFAVVVRLLGIVATVSALTDSTVRSRDMAEASTISVVGLAQLVLFGLAAKFLFTRTAKLHMRAVDRRRWSSRPDTSVPVVVRWVAAPLYRAVAVAVVVQASVALVDELPGTKRTWLSWVGSQHFSAFAAALLCLCLLPALLVVVRTFRAGRPWARITLTAVAGVITFLAVVRLTDPDTALGTDLVAGTQVALCGAAVVVSYWPPVNTYFRLVRRGPAGPAGPSSAPGPSGPFAPPEPS